MLDLNYTRERMLVEVEASLDTLVRPLTDPSDQRFFTSDQACIRLQGVTKEELFETLEPRLFQRFSTLPPELLVRDLVIPLKRGLGNAYRWGNRMNPHKRISVNIVVTNRGAMIAISDEGKGFDVAKVLLQFHEDEHYFTHRGRGFKDFEAAESVISYTEGGRTLLIRFLRPSKQEDPLGLAGDEKFMRFALTRGLKKTFRKNHGTLESLHIRDLHTESKDFPQVSYIMEYRSKESDSIQKTTLTGRVLPVTAASAEYSVARQLFKGPFKALKSEPGIRIPKPVKPLKLHPRLALFEFAPTTDLRSYLIEAPSSKEMTQVLRMVAAGLHTLHESAITLNHKETLKNAFEKNLSIGQRVLSCLQMAGSERMSLARQMLDRLAEKSARLIDCERAPIHGNFSWQCILYDGQRFFLYGFYQYRLSHPGLDVGGFLADLLWLDTSQMLHSDGKTGYYETGCTAFSKYYFTSGTPSWHDDLPFFVANAMLQRIDRSLKQPADVWLPSIDRFLKQWECALSPMKSICENLA